MKRVFGLIILFCAAISHAQDAEKARVDAIFGVAAERIERQNDAWFKDGEFPRIIQSLKFEHEIFPDSYDILTNLGWMLENVEENSDALALYIDYRNSRPSDPEAVYPEAEFYYKKKAFDKVPPLLEPSIKLATKPHPNTYRILAHSYERMNLWADALRIWKTYLALNPTDETAKANIAKVNKKLNAAGR